jgi:hypothetical protein
VLGNVVGANIVNITLIVGGAAVLRNMQIEKAMLQRDGYADVQAFWASPHLDPEAFRVVGETGTFLSREVFDEVRGLEI